jgi:hypothetical protein
MRYIKETLIRLVGSVLVFVMFVFCGLVAATATLLKGEDGCIEALEFNKRIIG